MNDFEIDNKCPNCKTWGLHKDFRNNKYCYLCGWEGRT